jgi:hypothetical protein
VDSPGAPPGQVRKAGAPCGEDGGKARWIAGGSGDGIAPGPGDLPGWDAGADARGLAWDGAVKVSTYGGGRAVERDCLRAQEQGERRRVRGAGAPAGTGARLPRGGGVRVRGGERAAAGRPGARGSTRTGVRNAEVDAEDVPIWAGWDVLGDRTQSATLAPSPGTI